MYSDAPIGSSNPTLAPYTQNDNFMQSRDLGENLRLHCNSYPQKECVSLWIKR